MNKKIIKLIEDRLEKGKREYEEELNPFDGRDWIVEALEEVADALVYITAKLIQIKKGEKYVTKCNVSSQRSTSNRS